MNIFWPNAQKFSFFANKKFVKPHSTKNRLALKSEMNETLSFVLLMTSYCHRYHRTCVRPACTCTPEQRSSRVSHTWLCRSSRSRSSFAFLRQQGQPILRAMDINSSSSFEDSSSSHFSDENNAQQSTGSIYSWIL